MRIVDRKTFLDLPNNIVYCEFTPNLFGEYRIKTQTLTNDFCFDSLLDFNSLGWDSNCGWFDMYSESLKTGLNIPLDVNSGFRDGCFDDSQLYAVFSKSDIETLIDKLKKTL